MNIFYWLFPYRFYMSSWIPAAIAAGGAILGGVLGNRANAREAEINRDFQRENMTHAHRYQVEDMRAAGLNPILSATGGAGAKASGGAQASQEDVLSPAVGSAMEAKRLSQELDNMKSVEANTVKDTVKKDSEIAVNKETLHTQKMNQWNLSAQGNLYNEQTRKTIADYDLSREYAVTEKYKQIREAAQAELARQSAALTSHSARSASVEADMDVSEAGRKLKWTNRASESAEGVSSAVRGAINPFHGSMNRGKKRR